jgi:hypothetical protein
MKKYFLRTKTILFGSMILATISCEKEKVEPTTSSTSYNIPSTYTFKDANGNSTVDYSGQTDRLNQLREMVAYMKSGNNAPISAQQLKDMFANTNDNGNGHFTFTSSGKQLKNKCFSLDIDLFEKYMDSIEIASIDHAQIATNGQAGTLTTATNTTYLFNKSGMEPLQFIEKGLMGAVFMHQALNVYFGDDKMSVDNSTVVDAENGKYYTALEHHWDEAFGYFGVSIDFPTTIPNDFWGKYSNNQNSLLSSNTTLMTNFIKGRAAITAKVTNDYNTAIKNIQNMWEDVSANQAIKYLNDAVSSFGTDDAKFLHVLSEAYAFTWCLRYVPTEIRNVTQTELTAIMELFGDNFWNLSLIDINTIKTALEAKY